MKKLLCLVMSVLMAVPLMMTAFAVEQKTEAEFEKYNLSAETEAHHRPHASNLLKAWVREKHHVPIHPLDSSRSYCRSTGELHPLQRCRQNLNCRRC